MVELDRERQGSPEATAVEPSDGGGEKVEGVPRFENALNSGATRRAWQLCRVQRDVAA